MDDKKIISVIQGDNGVILILQNKQEIEVSDLTLDIAKSFIGCLLFSVE